jgi:hypothetical protein
MLLQESGEEGAEAEDTGRGESNAACRGVGTTSRLSSAAAAGTRRRGTASRAGAGAGLGVSGGGDGSSASLGASASDNGRALGRVDNDGGGAADGNLEGGEGAGDVDQKVSVANGKTGGNGGDGGLRGHGRRESRLCGRNLGHAGDDTETVGLGEV